jgi:uncharacterized protein with von Willebrand factor type A (vWA) domain
MREIKIRGIFNGWIVTVGCKELGFNNLSTMLSEIKRYIDDPVKVEKEYLEKDLNKTNGVVVFTEGSNLTINIDGNIGI